MPCKHIQAWCDAVSSGLADTSGSPSWCRVTPRSRCSFFSTTVCVAMPAWSVPGTQRVLKPLMRRQRTIVSCRGKGGGGRGEASELMLRKRTIVSTPTVWSDGEEGIRAAEAEQQLRGGGSREAGEAAERYQSCPGHIGGRKSRGRLASHEVMESICILQKAGQGFHLQGPDQRTHSSPLLPNQASALPRTWIELVSA